MRTRALACRTKHDKNKTKVVNTPTRQLTKAITTITMEVVRQYIGKGQGKTKAKGGAYGLRKS